MRFRYDDLSDFLVTEKGFEDITNWIALVQDMWSICIFVSTAADLTGPQKLRFLIKLLSTIQGRPCVLEFINSNPSHLRGHAEA
jgi:hypothetical protein